MLFEPEAHERCTATPWSAERVRPAIAAIVADAEDAFDDGWPTHPLDEPEEEPRFRTLYIGGAGVVAALHRLQEQGLVELRRDYIPYLKRSLEQPDFPEEDAERSLWMGETGIRLVLQRLAPSRPNRERLAEPGAAHRRHQARGLLWGRPR